MSRSVALRCSAVCVKPGDSHMTTTSKLRRVFAYAVIAFALIAVTVAAAGPVAGQQQATRAFVWKQYDVTIRVENDSALLVTERFEAEFSGTPAFTYGYADIPTGRTEGINVIEMVEETPGGAGQLRLVGPAEFSRQPGTYTVSQAAETVSVEYGFEPATNEDRAFSLTYWAHGALQVYGEGSERTEQVWWNAISTEVTDLAPVLRASVTISLPAAVPLDQVVLGEDTPGPAELRTQDGKTWHWEALALSEGDDFVARMQFPAITSAAAPSWQTADDCQRQDWTEKVLKLIVSTFAGWLGIEVPNPCAG
jgi:hypothetical protein